MQIEAKTVVAYCLDLSVRSRSRADGCTKQRVLPARLPAALEELGSVRHAFDQSPFDHFVESIRASLGADAEAEIQRGRELSLDEAAAIALAATSEPD